MHINDFFRAFCFDSCFVSFAFCRLFFIIYEISYLNSSGNSIFVSECYFILFFFSWFVSFCFSVGDDDGLHSNKAKFLNNFVLNITRIEIVANWKVSSIWISANKSILVCNWKIESKNFIICLVLKHHIVRTIWRPNQDKIWSIGLIAFVKCVIYKIYRNQIRLRPTVDNVSKQMIAWFDLIIFDRTQIIILDYNVGAEAAVNQPMPSSTTTSPAKSSASTNNDVEIKTNGPMSPRFSQSIDNNNSVYQNCDAPMRKSTYNNRETLVCDATLSKSPVDTSAKEQKEDYYNFVAAVANDISRKQMSDRMSNGNVSMKRIPENLKLSDNESSTLHRVSSGPYIPISECISGASLVDRNVPLTPLNSLDPKFYENPRSHLNNTGLNLTNDQPYSPKRNNFSIASTSGSVSWSIYFHCTANSV